MTWLLDIYLGGCVVLILVGLCDRRCDLVPLLLGVTIWPLLVPWVLLDVVRAVRRLR